jgi:hypothetical protein
VESKIVELVEVENRVVITRGWRRIGWDREVIKGYIFSVRQEK